MDLAVGNRAEDKNSLIVFGNDADFAMFLGPFY